MANDLKFLKLMQRGIILFWAIWFTIVTLSDVTNFLQKLDLLSADFIFSSKNYDLVAQYLSMLSIKSQFTILGVFGLIIGWAFIAAILFWIAFFSVNSDFPYLAIFVSFCMTVFFISADEIFIQYSVEHGHTLRIILQVLTFLLFNNVSSQPRNSKY